MHGMRFRVGFVLASLLLAVFAGLYPSGFIALSLLKLDVALEWNTYVIVMAAEHPTGARYAMVDLTQPEPMVEQSLRQIQAFEQRLVQAMESPTRDPDVLGYAR